MKKKIWKFSWQKISIFFRWPNFFSPNAPKTSKTRKTRFLRFRKFWNFGSRFLKFSICYHLWDRKKKHNHTIFLKLFLLIQKLMNFQIRFFVTLRKFFNISKNRFEVFQISDFRGFRRPSYYYYYISQNTPRRGSTYRGDGFLRQGFQNAPPSR